MQLWFIQITSVISLNNGHTTELLFYHTAFCYISAYALCANYQNVMSLLRPCRSAWKWFCTSILLTNPSSSQFQFSYTGHELDLKKKKKKAFRMVATGHRCVAVWKNTSYGKM